MGIGPSETRFRKFTKAQEKEPPGKVTQCCQLELEQLPSARLTTAITPPLYTKNRYW